MIKTIRADFLFSKGQKHAKAGDWTNSITFFDRALTLNPNNFGIYLHKALSLSRQKKCAQALDIMKKAITLKPENHANYLFQGVIFYDHEDYENALKSFEKALHLSRGNPLVRCYISLTLLRLKKRIKEAYETLLLCLPDTNSDYQSRFMVFCENFLLEHKKLSKSLGDTLFYDSYVKSDKRQPHFLKTFIEKINLSFISLFGIFNSNKKNYSVQLFHARQLLRKGDLSLSIDKYNTALSYYHEFNEAFNELLDIYFYQKDYQNIIDCLNKLVEYKEVSECIFNKDKLKNEKEKVLNKLKDNVPLILIIGRYYLHSGDYKKATHIFETIVSNFSKNFYNHYNLALSHLGAGDIKNAFAFFQKAFKSLNPNVPKSRLEEIIRVSKSVSII